MTGTATTLILCLLTLLAIAYAVWMVYYITAENRRTKRSGSAELLPYRRHMEDIVGKSHFVLKERVSVPQAAIEPDSEPDEKKEDIFAPSNVPGHSRQIAPEELDEVFGDVPEGETNEPLDINFPLSAEPFPDSKAEEAEQPEEEEALPLRGASLAKGVRFEDMGEAYRLVVHNQQEITDRRKEETGRILLDLKGTDMFEAIVSGCPGSGDKVAYLMDTYLKAFHRRMSQKKGENDTSRSTPPGFDVRKYV